VGDHEVVSELLREDEVSRVDIDAEESPSDVRRGDVDARIRRDRVLSRKAERHAEDLVRIHEDGRTGTPLRASARTWNARPDMGTPRQAPLILRGIDAIPLASL